MSAPRVGVIMPYVKGRWNQMNLGLTTLVHQTVPVDSLCILNDGDDDWLARASQEARPTALEAFSGLVSVVHMRPEGAIRPPNRSILHGFRMVRLMEAEYVMVWYPEILAPPFAVEAMLARHLEGRRDVAPVLALSEAQTMALLATTQTGREDLTRWDVLDPWARSDPNFLSTETPLRITNAEAHGNIHHLNFTGAMLGEWDSLGLLPDTDQRAQNENWLREREMEAGRPPMACAFEVWHQWHPRLFPNEERRSARIGRVQAGGYDSR